MARMLLAGVPALVACLPAAADDPGKSEGAVIGKIGDQEIRADEIRGALAGLQPATLEAISKNPAQFEQLKRALTLQRVVLREALSKRWDQQPEVAAKITRARETLIAESYLESLARPPDDFPGAEELRVAYDAAKPGLREPRSFLLAQAFVAVAKDADKATQTKARARIAQVEKETREPGADFAAIARAKSDDSNSAARGGEIGWVAESQIQPEIRTQIERLPLHGTSAAIRLNDGWHILHVLDIREAHTPTLDQVRDKLVAELRAAKQKENARLYLASLLRANPLAISESGSEPAR
jgi:parvulin-like peptidyl-prolyl isomerase